MQCPAKHPKPEYEGYNYCILQQGHPGPHRDAWGKPWSDSEVKDGCNQTPLGRGKETGKASSSCPFCHVILPSEYWAWLHIRLCEERK